MPLKRFSDDGKFHDRFKQVLQPYFKLKSDQGVEPLNSWIFVVHYKYTAGLLVFLFISISSSWFASSPMECNLKFYRNEVKEFQKDLCLSYPYTLNENRERVYALHYRWIHWALLLLIPIYCIPLHLKKHFENDLINRFLRYIGGSNIRDPKRKCCIVHLIDGFIGFGVNNLFRRKITILFSTLAVNVVAFVFLDITLQNRFARLFPFDYPFTRWPQYFNDTLSQAFPPFAECRTGTEIRLMNRMEDTLGCNLTLMNVYDKMFVVMWLWIVGLFFLTITVIIYHIMLMFSGYMRKNLIKMAGCEADVALAAKYLDTGELIMLSSLFPLLTSEEKEASLKKISSTLKMIKKNKNVLK